MKEWWTIRDMMIAMRFINKINAAVKEHNDKSDCDPDEYHKRRAAAEREHRRNEDWNEGQHDQRQEDNIQRVMRENQNIAINNQDIERDVVRGNEDIAQQRGRERNDAIQSAKEDCERKRKLVRVEKVPPLMVSVVMAMPVFVLMIYECVRKRRSQ